MTDHDDVARSLGRMEAGLADMQKHIDTRIDAAQKHIDVRIDALTAQLVAHDSRVVQITARVHALETWKAKVMGIVIAIGAIAGLVANWVGKKLGI